MGVRECVESIRGRKKRGTQEAVEGRERREEGRENRICLCMYAEVLTLQFGGRGHPVSARLGAIYQRELSRGDTAGALASAALPRSDQCRAEDEPRSLPSSIGLRLKPQTGRRNPPPTDPPAQTPRRTIRSALSSLSMQSQNGCAILISSPAAQLQKRLLEETVRPDLRTTVIYLFFIFLSRSPEIGRTKSQATITARGSFQQCLFHRKT